MPDLLPRIAESLTPGNLIRAAAIYLGFIAVLFVGSKIVPGRLYPGAVLADGTRRTYKLNGLYLFLLVLALLAAAEAGGLFSLAAVHRLFWPLFVVANAFAFTLTGVHYMVGIRKQQNGSRDDDAAVALVSPSGEATAGGARRSAIVEVLHDAFMGTEVNPELWGVDLKIFAYRPSLIGLELVNLSFAAAQYHELGYLTTRMWLYQAFFLAYIVNYFQFEYGMLYTWDVIAEKFGWMLIWGDYVLVPFFYSLCGWWLLDNRDPLAPAAAAGLVAMYALGFWLFRGSNEQKHRYKEDPGAIIWGKPAEAIGGKLLVSGFWGIGRKLNYTGELMIYTAWTLTTGFHSILTGFHSILPYILPLWLAVLFPHRAWRDDQRCRAKYGPLWEQYCRRAKFRMIPFVY
jgi:Delta14-sterol reductase